jgi:heme exporter protein D
MHHETLYDFLMMSGYAWYVWPAYVITAGVLIGNLVAAFYGLKKEDKKKNASTS